MDYIILLAVQLICIVTSNYYFIHELDKKETKFIDEFHTLQKTIYTADEPEPHTSYELEQIEREKQWNERIARLTDEVNIQKKENIAEELHPLVHNVPHEEIDNNPYYNGVSEFEVSE